MTVRRLLACLYLAAALGVLVLALAVPPPVAVAPPPRPSPAPVEAPTPPRVARWIRGTIPGVDPADLEEDLQKLRGLDFRRVVPAAMQDKQALLHFLSSDPDQAPADVEYASLRVFGFVPPGFDVRKFRLELLESQVSGYYDPRTKRFNVVSQGAGPSWLGLSLVGHLLGFDPQAIITIHEMDHALDDQHFNLLAMEKVVKPYHDDDRELALEALFEGDATWIMMDYAMQGMPGGIGLDFMDEGRLQAWRDQSADAADSSLKEVNGHPVPLFFRRTLIFPYFDGMRFIHHFRLMGWNAVNRVWRAPPVSTQQILHPEKYPFVVPRRLRWPAPLRPLAGWQPVEENTLGEFLTTVFFEQASGDPGWQLAAHWRGDRYRIYRHGHALALAWASEWDSPEAAGTLSDRVRAAFAHMPHRLAGMLQVTRRGTRVDVIYGADAELARAVRPLLKGVR